MAKKIPDDVGGFPSTRGSLIFAARGGNAAARREALDELLRLYLPALRAYLLYRRRIDPDRAEDLLQAFIARQVVERQLLCRFDAARGRFRSFLLKSLQNFVFDQHEAGKAHAAIAESELAAEPDCPVFELEWSRQLLRETLLRMETDCASEGQAARWQLFLARVVVPTLTGGAEPSYRTLVDGLGFRSAEQACNALVTAKRQFQRTLRTVVSEMEHVLNDEEIDAEIDDLCAIARRTGPLGMDWDRKLIAGPQGRAARSAKSTKATPANWQTSWKPRARGRGTGARRSLASCCRTASRRRWAAISIRPRREVPLRRILGRLAFGACRGSNTLGRAVPRHRPSAGVADRREAARAVDYQAGLQQPTKRRPPLHLPGQHRGGVGPPRLVD